MVAYPNRVAPMTRCYCSVIVFAVVNNNNNCWYYYYYSYGRVPSGRWRTCNTRSGTKSIRNYSGTTVSCLTGKSWNTKRRSSSWSGRAPPPIHRLECVNGAREGRRERARATNVRERERERETRDRVRPSGVGGSERGTTRRRRFEHTHTHTIWYSFGGCAAGRRMRFSEEPRDITRTILHCCLGREIKRFSSIVVAWSFRRNEK